MLKKGAIFAVFVALFAYKFHFRPVDHAPDYLRRAVAHNIWNSIFFLTEKVRSATSSRAAIGFMQKAMMPTPTNEDAIEEIVDNGEYKIHFWRRKDLVEEENQPVAIFFHGGGFIVGDVPSVSSFYSSIAVQKGITVASVEYRLAPKHPFPAPSDDCIAATEYIINNSESLKINKDKIVLAGDSAGGELAIVTAIEVKFKMPDFNFAGLVPVYPCTQFLTHRMKAFDENESTGVLTQDFWRMAGANHAFGISAKTDEFIEEMKNKSVFKRIAQVYPNIEERFLGSEDEGDLEPAEMTDEEVELFVDPRFSPLLYSDEALWHLPETHLFTSEIDILYDDQRLFYEAASEAGANIKWTVWKGAAHCEQSFSTIAIGKTIAPSVDRNVEEMINVIADLLE
ncbi:Oidioi.mRNA.OKI2018_I69.chr1.g382.t1.cds [Oikopleura dioica]|uniref:Oidioi.mRNA.OKI2018_I69.chr1.g382.t1.cds n=1 Tax=Oikopleura dioica TaxID=34765 RepID=A0ABN7SJM5_OIKDI|nr:Oidioi.mRNA.OKI2018_I69.chr1.g382.t1.cds [Oikopleura dioica]